MPTLLLELSEPLYNLAYQIAEVTQQPLNTLLQNSIAQALPMYQGLPSALTLELTRLVLLNDVALWKVAGETWSLATQQVLDELLYKQSAGILTAVEQKQLHQIRHDYERLILRRAEAAILLKRRGYDVSKPTIFQQPLWQNQK